MHTITLFPINSVAHMVQPDEFHDLDIHSPAIEFFTDFKKHRPLTIEGSTLAVDVEMLMRKAHVRMKLVVDADDEFIGAISTEDLSEQNFMIRIANGERLDEITVSDMMCPKKSILALDLQQLERSSISDIIESLKRSGQQHCLVVDRGHDHIRGLISASDVARRLHMPIRIERVPTFLEIFRSIHRQAM
ncbi:MAG: CBS domain-containing protein [Pseudohongiella sp.]|nr:CBS domain-containing protein [Pseudohongiella sp.]MDO9518748.1 CBS domain-containing protein [Pseudohongiella sp.]MDP2126786.1 CBS domain-containing protein [Pseudohongiella sp.]